MLGTISLSLNTLIKLFCRQGDLEQLVLVPKAGQAQKQCSSQVVGVSTPSVNMHET